MIQDTIRTLFDAGDIDGIINQVNILMEDRTRVRAENEVFKHEIRRLAQAFANITEPATHRPISEGTTKKTLNPGPITKSKEALDIDL